MLAIQANEPTPKTAMTLSFLLLFNLRDQINGKGSAKIKKSDSTFRTQFVSWIL